MKTGIFYHPKFDYVRNNNTYYTLKLGYLSPHQFLIDRVKPETRILDIGCGPGYMAEELSKKSVKTISMDRYISDNAKKYSFQTIQGDVEAFNYELLPSVDTILLLDIIEHLRSPEDLFKKIRDRYCAESPEVVISTGNVAFFFIRLMLFFGQFNYGKRGILDIDHTRLFTFNSLRRVLINSGYDILLVVGIPAPFPLALGNHWFSNTLLKINQLFIRISKGLFSYQMLFVVRPKPTLNFLLNEAHKSSKKHNN